MRGDRRHLGGKDPKGLSTSPNPVPVAVPGTGPDLEPTRSLRRARQETSSVSMLEVRS
jgi:hypothetical protein